MHAEIQKLNVDEYIQDLRARNKEPHGCVDWEIGHVQKFEENSSRESKNCTIVNSRVYVTSVRQTSQNNGGGSSRGQNYQNYLLFIEVTYYHESLGLLVCQCIHYLQHETEIKYALGIYIGPTSRVFFMKVFLLETILSFDENMKHQIIEKKTSQLQRAFQ